MARLDRKTENRVIELRKSKLHWIVWLNILLTLGLYFIILMRL